MKQEIRRILDVFYPRRCPVCDGIVPLFVIDQNGVKEGGFIHEDCARKIRYVAGHTCMKCGKQLKSLDDSVWCSDCQRMRHHFKRNFGVFDYRRISSSIYRFKYMGRQEYADFYADATVKRLGSRLGKLHIDGIVPVPMYGPKKAKRGYNQAQLLAKYLSKELDMELEGLLLKPKETTRRRCTLKGFRNLRVFLCTRIL